MSTPYKYSADVARISRTPRTKRPPLYEAIRLRESARWRHPNERLPKAALHTVRRLLADVAELVAARDEAKSRPPQLAHGTHEVFIRRCPARGRRRETWTVEESNAGADWWGWVANAASFDEALRIALRHVEADGVISLLSGERERVLMAQLHFLPEHPVIALRRCVLIHGYQPISVWNWDATDPRCNSPGKAGFETDWQIKTGLPRFISQAQNTGIVSNNLRAIDIDVDDAEAARTALALALEHLARLRGFVVGRAGFTIFLDS